MFIYFLQINTLEVAHVHTSYVNVLEVFLCKYFRSINTSVDLYIFNKSITHTYLLSTSPLFCIYKKNVMYEYNPCPICYYEKHKKL